MPSHSLTGGRCKFTPPTAFVPGLAEFRAKVRPNKFHWQGSKPAVLHSIPQLERVLYQIGGQPECEYLLEYNVSDVTKLFFDVEWVSIDRLTVDQAFQKVLTEVIEPVNAFILSKTAQHTDVQELVVEEACRKLTFGGGYKQSFHVIYPNIAIRAKLIAALADHLELPALVDRAPYQGKSVNATQDITVMTADSFNGMQATAGACSD